MSGGSEERTLPPTARKLRQARRRGEVARSRELVTAVVTLAAAGALAWTGPRAFEQFGDAVGAAASLEGEPFGAALRLLLPRLAWAGLEALGPLLVLVVGAALLAGTVSNGGLVFATSQVAPKFERLDPVKGFGRLFKLRSLLELAKSALKLAVVLGVCAVLLRAAVGALVQVPACGLGCLPGVLRGALLPLLAGCCGAFLLLGLLDVGLQRWLFRRDQRMTPSEHKRDRRDSEGNPELLARRKRERQEEAQLGARTGVRQATFVVRSREVALALRYVRGETNVPILVARAGADRAPGLAAEARRRGVPVVFDPEATAAIAGAAQVGRMIPRAVFVHAIKCMKEAGVLG